MTRVWVEIESWYSDGHRSKRKVQLPPPSRTCPECERATMKLDDHVLVCRRCGFEQTTGDALTEWWEGVVYPETGDGHGERSPDLGYCYAAQVVDADDPSLIGLSTEWVGS